MISTGNILILTPGFPKDENDYLCVPPLQDFLLAYKNVFSRVNFTVIAFQYPFVKKTYNWKGIMVHSMGGRNNFIKKIFVWMNTIKKAIKLNKKIPFDAIHSLWLGECALAGNILSKKFGCRHICTLMGQDTLSSNIYFKLLNKKFIKIVSLSKKQTDLLIKNFNLKPDAEVFWGISKIAYDANLTREIDLLGVGSLTRLKNYELFIRVVSRLKEYFPDLVCKLIGNGPELAKLKDLIRQNGISNHLELLGKKSREEIFALMQKSKIFFHPSIFEGSGYVFAEALANGMHIVSFNVGYARPMPKWNIAAEEKDFILIIKKLLSEKLSFEPENIFPISETVKRYHELYSSGYEHNI